jgi:hypothetical protein
MFEKKDARVLQSLARDFAFFAQTGSQVVQKFQTLLAGSVHRRLSAL